MICLTSFFFQALFKHSLPADPKPGTEEINFEQSLMVVKLLVNLEQELQQGLIKTNQVGFRPLQDKEFHWLDWLLIAQVTKE